MQKHDWHDVSKEKGYKKTKQEELRKYKNEKYKWEIVKYMQKNLQIKVWQQE